MQAKFTEGSIDKHVSAMTFASMAGLMSLFLVDLVDMYWLSLLGEIAIAAAIGYAGSVLFFTLSLCIGLSIGCSAMVSHAVGAGDKAHTAKLVGNVFTIIVVITVPISIGVVFFLTPILKSLGASGDALVLAQSYLKIILPSLFLLAIAMATSGVIRALGFAKMAMYVTLLGGMVNAVLDPIFIFTFGWGIEGAALATFASRIAMVALGLYLVARKYELLSAPDLHRIKEDVTHYCQTAIPAVLTNLSSPIGLAFVTASMAQFGDSAVAGHAIISKIQPLAFAGLFALSGSIGPIAGQNLGAKKYDRIMQTLSASVRFILIYCVVVCGLLALLTNLFISLFHASGDAALLIRWFCYGLSIMFVFNGITFATNALFNNLHVASWATVLNFLKATVFTMPFVYLGALWFGVIGVYGGLFLGAAIVALLGLFVAYKKIRSYK